MQGISSKALGLGGVENKKGYAGNEIQNKEFSEGCGFNVYDFIARTYDQQLGRFIQIDPMTDEGGQESWSPYHYTYNNPTTFSDPDGKFPIPLIWAVYAILTSEATVTTAAVVTTAVVVYKAAPEINLSIPAGNGTASLTVGGSAAQIDFAIERQLNRANSTSKTATSSKAQGKVVGGMATQAVRVLATSKHGGGKNAQHTNQKARNAASEKYEAAKKQYEELNSRPNKTKETVVAREAARKQMKHWKQKMDNTGENHSQKAKGTK